MTRTNVFCKVVHVNKRVSIHDVAKRSGVSISTVSRVINDNGYPISATLRERVLAAVGELSYTPSLAAQSLRRDFNHVIGLISRDISNGFFGEIAKGVTERAMQFGHLSFVCNTGRSPVNEMDFHELLWKNRVKGIVLAGGGFENDEYRHLLERQVERCRRFGLRIVANTPQGIELPTVSVDFAGITEGIVEYLAASGHTRIGMVTGDRNVLTSRYQEQGFLRGLKTTGVQCDPCLTHLDAFTEGGGYSGCNALFAGAKRPTAVICGSDLIAIGVLHALHNLGLTVPGDVSLVSIGDTPLALHLRPALTSVRVPRYEMGSKAVDMILADDYRMDEQVFLPTELIVRDST